MCLLGANPSPGACSDTQLQESLQKKRQGSIGSDKRKRSGCGLGTAATRGPARPASATWASSWVAPHSLPHGGHEATGTNISATPARRKGAPSSDWRLESTPRPASPWQPGEAGAGRGPRAAPVSDCRGVPGTAHMVPTDGPAGCRGAFKPSPGVGGWGSGILGCEAASAASGSGPRTFLSGRFSLKSL